MSEVTGTDSLRWTKGRQRTRVSLVAGDVRQLLSGNPTTRLRPAALLTSEKYNHNY